MKGEIATGARTLAVLGLIYCCVLVSLSKEADEGGADLCGGKAGRSERGTRHGTAV
jgi:hypothetical protein